MLRDEQEGSVIISIISQLRFVVSFPALREVTLNPHPVMPRIGMDLQKVSFPTFVLEPRSMLERITDFLSHPDLIFGADLETNSEERFVRILQYYLSGWHVKPKGVKKP